MVFILKLISMLNYRRNSGLQQSGLNSEVVLFPGWSYCEVLLYNAMIMLGLGVGLGPVYFRFKNKHMYIMLSNILSLRFNCVHVRGMVV